MHCRHRNQRHGGGTPRRRAGFSLIELLVVIGIISILIALAAPIVARVRKSARNTQCIANLRQISDALHDYALQNHGRFPDASVADKSWEQMLDGLTDVVFQCPADEELAPAVGSSYDWRDTGRISTTMSGRLRDDVRRSDVVLVFESLPGWHAKSMINVARLDGSVQTMSADACFTDLDTPVRDARDAPILAR